ncbi:MAG: hypothetical protein NVS2B9_07620 [Myxococcales bacterium]
MTHEAPALASEPVSGTGHWSIELVPTAQRALGGNLLIQFTLREAITGSVSGVREGSGWMLLRPDGTFVVQDCGLFVGSIEAFSGTATMCVVAWGAGPSIQGRVHVTDGAGGLAGVRASATFTGMATGPFSFAGTYASQASFPPLDGS